jgi:hypothetical protein
MRISYIIADGYPPKPDPQETISLFNNSDEDLTATIIGNNGETINETLIYPLVMCHISRPLDNQIMRLTVEDRSVDLMRKHFKRKMNVVEIDSIPDLSKCIRTYQMWHQHILSMSDKITISDNVEILYKDKDDVGTNKHYIFLIVVILIQVVIIVVICILTKVMSLNLNH